MRREDSPMPSAMLLILQAAAAATGTPDEPAPVMGPVLPAPSQRKKPALDVAELALECHADQQGEIVVCAERDDARYRLQPLPELADEPDGLPRAETALFGKVKASADLDSEELQQGQISKRLMLRFTLPF
jgi:hypothetical protein